MRLRRILITLALCLLLVLLVLPVSAHSTAIRSRSHRRRIGDELPTVRFDLSQVTFTAGMDKRIAPGPFAAAPIMQGPWDGIGVPDTVKFPRGNQVVGSWYENIDAHQGTIVFWITPEWDGDDGLTHNLFASRYDNVKLRKFSDGLLQFTVNNDTVVVDISGWDAGTTYNVVPRWDTRNDIDGTDYLALSVDNVHTFKITSPPGVGIIIANIVVGASTAGTPGDSADAIIEGLHVYRRVLYDGAYGTDVGNGDELQQIYAAGVGADPTLVTGSWDVVFALPTNSSAEELTSGTGEAWSHPHSSAVMADSWMETTYGSSAWDTVGTPSAGPGDIAATANQLFGAGGYQWTSDATGQGITQTVSGRDVGSDYVIRVLAHSDVTLTTRIYDVTNGAYIVDDFIIAPGTTVAAPAVSIFTFELPTSARNGVGSDSTAFAVEVLALGAGDSFVHQVEVQENLIDNPSLETGAGNPWIPDGWTNDNLDPGDSQASSTGGAIIHSGSDAIQFNVSASGEQVYQNNTLTVGRFYGSGGWVYGDGAVSFVIGDRADGRGILQYSATARNVQSPTAAAWNRTPRVIRVDGNPVALSVYVHAGASGARYLDDWWLIPLDDVSLTVTPASEANSAESGGIRIDGDDVATQDPEGVLRADTGRVLWGMRPRHAPATAELFGSDDPRWMKVWFDASNFLSVALVSSGSGRLRVRIAGATTDAFWITTGDWAANDLLEVEARWMPSGAQVLIDGVVVAEIESPGALEGAPTTIHWGDSHDGHKHIDAVFLEP